MRPAAAPVLALLLVAFPALLPAASAQLPVPAPAPGAAVDVQVTLELQDPGEPLIPERPYSLTLTVHYQYASGAAVPPEVPPADPARGGQACGTVSVPQPPPWATVRILPEQVCFRLRSSVDTATTASNTTIVEVNVTEGAPALEAFNFTVAFDSPPTGNLAAGHGETSRVIMPAYVGSLELVVPEAFVVRGGSPQPLPITVRNLGNGPVEVRFQNVTGPQGVRVTPPARFVIAEPNGTATVDAVVEAPWTTQVRGLLSMDVASSHPTRPDLQGDTPRVRTNLEGKAAVPGLEPAVLVAALAALAVLRRR